MSLVVCEFWVIVVWLLKCVWVVVMAVVVWLLGGGYAAAAAP